MLQRNLLSTPTVFFWYYWLVVLMYIQNLPSTTINKQMYVKILQFYKFTKLPFWKLEKFLITRVKKKQQYQIGDYKIQHTYFCAYSFMVTKALFGRWKFFYKLKQKKAYIRRFRFFKRRHIRFAINTLKYIHFSRVLTRYTAARSIFFLRQRITLNYTSIKKALMHHFYKKVKYKLLERVFKNYSRALKKPKFKYKNAPSVFYRPLKTKLFFLNFYKKQYWKFRSSRITHWEGLRGGTLNKYRYQKFIHHFVKYTLQDKSLNFYALLICHFSNLTLSWRQIYLLTFYKLVVINGQYLSNNYTLERGDIIEVCYGKGLAVGNYIYKHLNSRIVYRLKRWSYKNQLATEKSLTGPKSKVYRPVPKAIQSIGFAYKKYGKSFIYARSLGLVGVMYLFERQTYEPIHQLYRTSLIKLHDWRYRC